MADRAVTILHTNDLHGYPGTIPRLAALIRRERAGSAATLLLDAGDLCIREAPAPLFTRLVSLLGYDAVCPGNDEEDEPRRGASLDCLGIPVVAANLPADRAHPCVRPFIVREVGGLRVAVLGLTTAVPYPRGHLLAACGRDTARHHDPVRAARAHVPGLRRQSDAVVVLSHLGLREDIRLALKVPGIDCIIGGHSHHRLFEPLRIRETSIFQAGAQGAYLGVIDLQIDGGRIVAAGRLEPVWQDVTADPRCTAAIDTFVRTQRPEAAVPIGRTPGCWADPWVENPWADLVLDEARALLEADIAVLKAMMVFPVHDPGEFTGWDVEMTVPGLPFFERSAFDGMVAVELRGSEVLAILEHAVSDLAFDTHARAGPAATWPGNNLLQTAGIELSYDLRRPRGRRVAHALVAGRELSRRARYRVATCAFLEAGFSGYRWFAGGRRCSPGPDLGMREMIADIVARRLSSDLGGSLPAIDGRLRFAS